MFDQNEYSYILEMTSTEFYLFHQTLYKIEIDEICIMKGSKYSTLKSNKSINDSFNSLSSLSGLSQIVARILNDWLEIRRFIDKTGGRKTLSKFEAIDTIEIMYLEQLTKHFESDFENNKEFLKNISHQIKEGKIYDRNYYHSIRLFGAKSGASFLYPWNLFVEINYNDDTLLLFPILENLLRNKSYRSLGGFIDLFNEIKLDSSIKRSKLGVRYIQTLTHPIDSKTQHGFYNQKEFAGILNCSESALHRLDNVFRYLQVIGPRYITNMAKLGFQAVQVNHNDSLPEILDPFILRTYFTRHPRFSSILYIPIDSDVIQYVPKGFQILNFYQLSRNFDQLYYKVEKSWLYPVRFLLDEDRVVIESRIRKGLDYNLTSKFSSQIRPLIDFVIIDQIAISGYYQEIADALGTSESYLRDRFQILLSEGIITPFYDINRIGLNVIMFMSFEGSFEEIQRIINNLYAFPYAELFWGKTKGFAIMKLPNKWLPTYLKDVLNLQKNGINIWTTISSPVKALWGIKLSKIVEKQEFFGIQWKY